MEVKLLFSTLCFISEALRDVGLLLVGPFDVLSGNLKRANTRKLSLYLIHWRYYYDPPEFQVYDL
jgi:hypothetical protein